MLESFGSCFSILSLHFVLLVKTFFNAYSFLIIFKALLYYVWRMENIRATLLFQAYNGKFDHSVDFH